MMSFSYGQIETALKNFLYVEELEMPAFRARLRRLRDLGLPSIQKTGSGSKAVYEELHAIELATALTLSGLGVAPRWLKALVGTALKYIEGNKNSNCEVFAVFSPEGRVMAQILGREDLLKYIGTAEVDGTSVVNLTRIGNRIRSALG